MNSQYRNVIDSIEDIDDIMTESESNTLTEIINAYSKAYTILENYEGEDVDSFTVFSEGYYMEADEETKSEKEEGSFFRRIDEKTGKKEGILKSIIWSIPRIFKVLWDKIVGIFKKATGKLTNRADVAVKKIESHDKEVVEVADAVTAEVMDEASEKQDAKDESDTKKHKKKKKETYTIKSMDDEPPELIKLKSNLKRFMTNALSKSEAQKELMSFKTFSAKNKTFMDLHTKVEKIGWTAAAVSSLGFLGPKIINNVSFGPSIRMPKFLTNIFIGLTAVSGLVAVVNRIHILWKYLSYSSEINKKRRATLVCIKQLEREIDFCKKIDSGADSVVNRCDAIFAAKGKEDKVSAEEISALIDYIFNAFVDDKEVTITKDDYVDIIKDENLEKVKNLVKKYSDISKTVPGSFSRLQKAIDKTCSLAAKKFAIDDETSERIKKSKRQKGQQYSVEEKIVFLNQFSMIMSGMIEHMNSNVELLVETLEAIGYACDEIKKIESSPNASKQNEDTTGKSDKDKDDQEDSSDEGEDSDKEKDESDAKDNKDE